ncbi:MAG: sugar phosphate nucleotidyltransferase [Opitutaceae bacterium]
MFGPIVRKAVIPAAGLGTRHFPASHAVMKELFPVVGPDGISRALIHYHLIELAAAGIEEICIIVQPGDEATIRRYFDGPGDAYLKRLAKYPQLLAEAAQMKTWANRLHFREQKTQEGFGHAVFQTRDFAAGEAVLLCLGDHLFRGAPDSPSPHVALVRAASLSGGKTISAVNRIGPDDLRSYGTIAGKRRAAAPELIDVELIIEKPDVATARARLRVDGLGDDEFLGWFGMHVLAPSIYDVLARMIRDDVRDGGEFQLTRAQEIQRQREGYLALEIKNGQRFDFGVPDDFVRAVQEFRKP